ncbi:hypothetical protein ACLQ28_08755 [Micromonospora sp. DT201]|uniref:hypothetical protein n=1 Tax=Micromonospora sp. DT201 TaxID=3393442 RepID=UPI003CFA6B97
MIERGTGRTSGLTDWQLMDVNSMWACLHDHDTTNHWKQVAGWRKVCDLAQIHLSRLQEYRRGLAEAWPPETSAASSTYLAELDELIDKVQRTHNAAAANYTALSAATQAISTTRATLRKIHEEYATKFQQKQAYESMAADPKAVMGNRVTEAPVTDAELERLNVQARAAMFNLSSELQQAQATLQKPPPSPRANPGIDQGDPDVYGPHYAAPIIPPVVPVPIRRSPTIRPSAAAGQAPSPTKSGIGPVLGGTGNATAPNPGHLVPPNSATPLTPSSSTPGFGAPPLPPVISARGYTPGTGRTQSHPTDHSPGGTGTRGNPTAQPRPMPPNGLIGGTPGMGIGQSGGGAGAPRRINPVGGLIGGGGAGTGPTGGAGSRPGGGRGSGAMHGIPPFGSGAGINGGINTSPGGIAPARPDLRPSPDDEKPRWDPDHPWETDEGVAPVLQPRNEDDPIDPGPAIGRTR